MCAYDVTGTGICISASSSIFKLFLEDLVSLDFLLESAVPPKFPLALDPLEYHAFYSMIVMRTSLSMIPIGLPALFKTGNPLKECLSSSWNTLSTLTMKGKDVTG